MTTGSRRVGVFPGTLGVRRRLVDAEGERYELREAFDAYPRFGGMPGIADFGFNTDLAATPRSILSP